MNDLCFCSAAYGGWGIVRMGTLVPETHLLFVCPYSCGRHNSIGAIQHGYKDKVSYLYIDEKDIALGTVQEDLCAAAGEVLSALEFQPRVMLVYFSCVLYMSGFDMDDAVSELNERYPETRFEACLMNPIAAATKKPPALTMVITLCDLWDFEGQPENTLNLIGNYVELDEQSELFDVLKACGISAALHFSQAKTYEEYRKMGHSRYNLVLRPEGLLAAKSMSAIMDYRFVPVSYDLEQIERQYADIFQMLGKSCDLLAYSQQAQKSIDAALGIVGNRKIAVGSSAVCRPFSLARALISYGFAVCDLFYDGCPSYEKEAREDLAKNHPEVTFHDIHDPALVGMVGHCGNAEVAIGYSAGYYTGAKSVVDLMTDEKMFGYRGLELLMELLCKSVTSPQALDKMINSYGLII